MGDRGPVAQSAFRKRATPAKGVGKPPTTINDDAKRIYLRLSKILSDRLEPEDEDVLAQVSQSLAEIAMANVALARDGYVVTNSQGEAPSPWVRVRALAHAEFKSGAIQLGLTPSSRMRIKSLLETPEEQGGPAAFDSQTGEHSA